MSSEMLTLVGARTRAVWVPVAITLALAVALVAMLTVGSTPASAQGASKRVLLYTGTTGYRHADAINNGGPVVKAALQAAGYTVDVEDCDNNGGAVGNCDNADKN